MQLLKTRGLAPTIICESAGTQAEDAAALKNCMNKAEKAQKQPTKAEKTKISPENPANLLQYWHFSGKILTGMTMQWHCLMGGGAAFSNRPDSKIMEEFLYDLCRRIS